MHANDLDDLHENYTVEEILEEVKRRLKLDANLSLMDIFLAARRKYYGSDAGAENAVIDSQRYNTEGKTTAYRFPVYLGSWVMKQQAEPAT